MTLPTPRLLLLTMAVVAGFCLSAGCRSDDDFNWGPTQERSNSGSNSDRPGNAAAAGPLFYLRGEPVGYTQGAGGGIGAAMLDAAGGQAVADLVLEHDLRDRLAERGVDLDDEALDVERRKLLSTLSDDPDNAARLLAQLRDARGLGDRRFASLLWRNAALRLLIRDDVTIDEPLLRQAYAVNHGPRVQARILTAATLAEARGARRRIAAGEAFADVAAELSTDASGPRGGLLPPISPADPTYPRGIREAIANLEPAALTDLLSLDSGYALLQGVRKLPADGVTFEDAKPELERGLRTRLERLRMESLARTLLQKADVVILDPTLAQRWQQQVDPPAAPGEPR